jgi:hypothetical protein
VCVIVVRCKFRGVVVVMLVMVVRSGMVIVGVLVIIGVLVVRVLHEVAFLPRTRRCPTARGRTSDRLFIRDG